MKKHIIYSIVCGAFVSLLTSCVDGLLNQDPTEDVSEAIFWKSMDDAESALTGVYQATRTFFFKNYAWDGASDIVWSNVGSYQPSSGIGSQFDPHWANGYQVINRSNYALVHIEDMLSTDTKPEDQTELKRIKGELYFMRALAYFRLMDLWGDVPFYTNVLSGNKEAYSLSRTPRKDIKDHILADLDYAKENVPVKIPDSDRGRATRAAVYGFSGKIKLYWACWSKNDNNQDEAMEYYKAAAADFAEVMKPEYGLKLYKDGEPGTPTAPTYAELFNGLNDYNSEVIFATSNAGPGFAVGIGDPYVYDFATRSTGNGGCNYTPTIRLMDKYQLLSTGDYAEPLIASGAEDKETIPNGACNPKSYEGRDYRMYATTVWEGQKMLRVANDGRTVGPDSLTFKYKYGDNVTYINAQGPRTGYIFRKYVRDYAFGARDDGQQDTYLMRLPDLWLMYCEAVNEVNNGPTDELFELVDKIRHRGALPPLDRGKFGTKEEFFKAIEQERIIELVAEGHRFFDIRRWRIAEKLWPAPDGYRLTSTWGEGEWYRDEFKNAQERDFKRYYLIKIPVPEITNNPNIVQNDGWY